MSAGTADSRAPARLVPGRRLPPGLLVGGTLLGTWLLLAIFAPLVAGVDPNALDLLAVLQPPSGAHWLGTDHLGRDVFARVIYSARIDLWMGFAGVAAPLLIGSTIGLLAGYLGGAVDAVLMRVVDVAVAFPFFVLVLAIVAMLGPGLANYFVALAVVGWVAYARIMRAEVLVLRTTGYVLAARTLGFGPLVVMTRHILPNAVSAVLVYAMTDAILVVLAGASLGFLGLGVQPPTPEWGVMIADGQPYVVQAWWICLFPGLATISLGFGLSLLGDGLAQLLRGAP